MFHVSSLSPTPPHPRPAGSALFDAHLPGMVARTRLPPLHSPEAGNGEPGEARSKSQNDCGIGQSESKSDPLAIDPGAPNLESHARTLWPRPPIDLSPTITPPS